MTRDEIATFVVNKFSLGDATTIARCNDSIQRRFEMIYDSDLWQDTPRQVTSSTVDTTGIFSFPAGVNRIIRIRSHGDHPLIPVTSEQLIELDPTMFERTGDPIYYECFADPDASYAKKVRVWPKPTSSNSPVALLIVAKMTAPTLVASDSPSTYVRNIDNCLIAYVEGDIWTRLRQVGKANTKFQEAGALLQEMRDLENKQAEKQLVIMPDVDPTDVPLGFGYGYLAKI